MPYGTQHAVAGAPITEADYKYTGKEQQTAFGLDNLYDSQARFQYVTDGSFMSHDPLSGDFSDISPYMYCGGDPINRADWNGMWFTENLQTAVNALLDDLQIIEHEIIAKFGALYEELNDPNCKRGRVKRINKIVDRETNRLKEITKTRREINILKESNQGYDIQYNAYLGKNPNMILLGETIFSWKTKFGTIRSPKSEIENPVLLHELKHLYQFETGYLSFAVGPERGNIYYDYEDEVEAFARVSAIYRHEPRFPDSSYDRIRRSEYHTSGRIGPDIFNSQAFTSEIFRYYGVTYIKGEKLKL